MNSSLALLTIELTLTFISYSELSSFSSSSSSLSTSLSSPPAPNYAYLAIIGRALDPRTLLPTLSTVSISLLALFNFWCNWLRPCSSTSTCLLTRSHGSSSEHIRVKGRPKKGSLIAKYTFETGSELPVASWTTPRSFDSSY